VAHNPLEEYRRAQRALRRDFDAFTAEHCPSCPAPCCVRPARIAPTDILLAEASGWRPRPEAVTAANGKDLAEQAAATAARALGGEFEDKPNPPCEHLGPRGCSFPADLRPFGCTAYICPIMRERLDRKTLGRIKRLVRNLEERHTDLMAHLHKRTG